MADVVLGLHGGKYNFGAGGAQAAAGEAFASSLATSSSSSSAAAAAEEEEVEVEVPRWAQELVVPAEDSLEGMLAFDAAARGAARVTVKNECRTWEPFVAAVVLDDTAAAADGGGGGGGGGFFAVSPRRGHFAPRGGANNVCDAAKPYADWCEFTVRYSGGGVPPAASLVVKTESPWTWRLIAEERP